VGALVLGFRDGRFVIITVGLTLGILEGDGLGFDVGDNVGDRLGKFLGILLGVKLGSETGEYVGSDDGGTVIELVGITVVGIMVYDGKFDGLKFGNFEGN
jgi:hypothetical protein